MDPAILLQERAHPGEVIWNSSPLRKRMSRALVLAGVLLCSQLIAFDSVRGDYVPANNGVFYDDYRNLTGSATAHFHFTDGAVTGTLTLANQTLNVSAASQGQVLINNSISVQQFDGTASVGGYVGSARVNRANASGFIDGHLQLAQGQLVHFLAHSDPTTLQAAKELIFSNNNYTIVSSFDVTLLRPIVDFANAPLASDASSHLIELQQIAAGLDNSTYGSQTIDQNGHYYYGQGPGKGRVRFGMAGEAWTPDSPTTFDQLDRTGQVQFATLWGWTDARWVDQGVASFMISNQQIQKNPEGKWNPIRFYDAHTSDGTNGQFTVRPAFGYGHLRPTFEISYVDPSGPEITISEGGRAAYVNIDWGPGGTWPFSADSAIGLQVQIGTTVGESAFYPIEGSAHFSFGTAQCVIPPFFFCVMDWQSGSSMANDKLHWASIHVDHWNSEGNDFPYSTELGDRWVGEAGSASSPCRPGYENDPATGGARGYAHPGRTELCFDFYGGEYARCCETSQGTWVLAKLEVFRLTSEGAEIAGTAQGYIMLGNYHPWTLVHYKLQHLTGGAVYQARLWMADRYVTDMNFFSYRTDEA